MNLPVVAALIAEGESGTSRERDRLRSYVSRARRTRIMRLEQLRGRLSGSASATLELERSTGQLDRAGETLCAFLDGGGGTVVSGVTAEGRSSGRTSATRRGTRSPRVRPVRAAAARRGPVRGRTEWPPKADRPRDAAPGRGSAVHVPTGGPTRSSARIGCPCWPGRCARPC